MDKLAGRILKEQVRPKLEKLLDGAGLSEKELTALGMLVDICKDLVECDTMMTKLKTVDEDI